MGFLISSLKSKNQALDFSIMVEMTRKKPKSLQNTAKFLVKYLLIKEVTIAVELIKICSLKIKKLDNIFKIIKMKYCINIKKMAS